MISEKEFEDIICKYPELLEDGLTFQGRQLTLYGRRMDILFDDKHKRKLIIELKVGPIKDEHIGQILSYEGMLLSAEDPTIRVMLVGNRVPPNIQRSLDHHGIAWKEITISALKDYLSAKNDADMLKLFDEAMPALSVKPVSGGRAAESSPARNGQAGDATPALLALVEEKWMELAFSYFKDTGKEKLCFYTSSPIGKAASLDIRHVYFKLKGRTDVSVIADWVDFTEEIPREYRLPGYENDTGKYYYGFKSLRQLDQPIDLIDLKYYESSISLRNDVPGACIIADPLIPHAITKTSSGITMEEARQSEAGLIKYLKENLKDTDLKTEVSKGYRFIHACFGKFKAGEDVVRFCPQEIGEYYFGPTTYGEMKMMAEVFGYAAEPTRIDKSEIPGIKNKRNYYKEVVFTKKK